MQPLESIITEVIKLKYHHSRLFLVMFQHEQDLLPAVPLEPEGELYVTLKEPSLADLHDVPGHVVYEEPQGSCVDFHGDVLCIRKMAGTTMDSYLISYPLY